MPNDIAGQLIARFLRYVALTSQSDPSATRLPSTQGQQRLAELLATELRELGMTDIQLDQQATVTAVKPGNVPGAPRIGFIAHLDTVDVGLSPDIHPQLLRFTGEDLCLNAQHDIWLRTAEHPEILAYHHQDILFSDGTSVLGADNKAAITAIMTMLANLEEDTPHGDIVVAFVPDEEIGLRGAKALAPERFAVDFAYTIDCCEVGEVVYENFNAASAVVTLTGVTAHPMSAKNVLVNPLLMAQDFIAAFDRRETPEHTAGREGYFWFNDMAANASQARLTISIRDFDQARFNWRKQRIGEVAADIAGRYPTGKVHYEINDIYSNISNAITGDRRAIDLIFAGLAELGIEPKVTPMRGGTDGAALSARGLLTPNYFTGAHNFHSPFEFLPISSFVGSYNLTRKLCLLAAKS
ncbi:peptidase T [Sodalis sp. RH21]|uniref:peptidase T n=1 Tax=unclassified Sodalis (in: enterobacteria) TaxID=2636512 RepID=UPI0039B36702